MYNHPSFNLLILPGVLNALDPSRKAFFTSLKEENIANTISMFYSHHVVENAVSGNCTHHK